MYIFIKQDNENIIACPWQPKSIIPNIGISLIWLEQLNFKINSNTSKHKHIPHMI